MDISLQHPLKTKPITPLPVNVSVIISCTATFIICVQSIIKDKSIGVKATHGPPFWFVVWCNLRYYLPVLPSSALNEQ